MSGMTFREERPPGETPLCFNPNTLPDTISDNLLKIDSGREVLDSVLSDNDLLVRVIDVNTNRVLYQNPALGKLAPKGMEQPCYSFWQREDRCEECVSLEAVRKRHTHRKTEKTSDGSVYEVLALPVKDGDGNVNKAIEIIRDITAVRKMETDNEELRMQMLQSQKMAAVGNLLSGVIHSINSPLSGIALYSEALLRKAETAKDMPIYEELRNGLSEIKEAAARCDAIVKDLLFISRTPRPDKTGVNMCETLERILNVVEPQLKLMGIQIVKELQPGPCTVSGSQGQLETVFMNLISNAMDAMAGGGTLFVRCQNKLKKKKVEIDITDTGAGIAKEHLPYVFNPYFTTKPPGKGTGIGLSLVRQIIQSHKGNIEINSVEGRGTAIKIRLPIHK